MKEEKGRRDYGYDESRKGDEGIMATTSQEKERSFFGLIPRI